MHRASESTLKALISQKLHRGCLGGFYSFLSNHWLRGLMCVHNSIGVGAGGAEGAKAPPGLTKIVLLSVVFYFNLCTFDEIINLRPPRYYDLPTPM